MHPAASDVSRTAGKSDPPHHTHAIRLSRIDRCMPQTYIRLCLAYHWSDGATLDEVLKRLNLFARSVVDAKPYLAGYVVSGMGPQGHSVVESIQFTDEDFIRFPPVQAHRMSCDAAPLLYHKMNQAGLPPSLIRPEEVSTLPSGMAGDRAPVFGMRANVVDGGLIVSIYLHHSVGDGTTLSLIATGTTSSNVCAVDHGSDCQGSNTLSLNQRLSDLARPESLARDRLSTISTYKIPDQLLDRKFYYHQQAQSLNQVSGRGCIFVFCRTRITCFAQQLGFLAGRYTAVTTNDVLRKSRKVSVKNLPSPTNSTS